MEERRMKVEDEELSEESVMVYMIFTIFVFI